MRKKLDTRFPAARIKKIMQADEDVGKIALAVPVLVSKSLELFLQDLCDRTYEITLERGAKTVSSLHLKHCVERYNVFDFLREVVSKVPDYGPSQGQGHGDVTMDDRSISKRRKPISNEVNDSDEEYKKSKTLDMGNAKPSGRGGRGRGRGRGRGGRAAKIAEREGLNREVELETAMMGQPPPQDSTKMDVSESSPQENDKDADGVAASNDDTKPSPKEGIDFDLNAESLDLNETKLAPATATTVATAAEEYPGWPMMDIGKIDPAQLASLGKRIDEDEEDYDEEG
ncbi:Nuclear transcription factor Y subunit C-3 [Cardamine amara subsp. amara]|uniref:Nuclear transcription factor Y subunit C-3 n=1 Tax=Cardamine amara subsp. amara TaxID=228776 RepID=A0ABD1ADA8_CARAN